MFDNTVGAAVVPPVGVVPPDTLRMPVVELAEVPKLMPPDVRMMPPGVAMVMLPPVISMPFVARMKDGNVVVEFEGPIVIPPEAPPPPLIFMPPLPLVLMLMPMVPLAIVWLLRLISPVPVAMLIGFDKLEFPSVRFPLNAEVPMPIFCIWPTPMFISP